MAKEYCPTYHSKEYSEGRPTYPAQLFQFIASKTPCHDVAWDVGTGTGQAIPPLAEIYKTVIGTDIGANQLELAPTLPNVRYAQTPRTMKISELETHIGPQSTIDLVTVAQAMHWFDLPKFYDHVRWVLKKPNGVIAAWCYAFPTVGGTFDAVFREFHMVDMGPYWEKPKELVDGEYRDIEFPFEPVHGLDATGPFEFWAEKEIDLDWVLRYVRSWSAYKTAKESGVELLSEEVVERFRRAWEEGGGGVKLAKFAIFLRIGRVGNCE